MRSQIIDDQRLFVCLFICYLKTRSFDSRFYPLPVHFQQWFVVIAKVLNEETTNRMQFWCFYVWVIDPLYWCWMLLILFLNCAAFAWLLLKMLSCPVWCIRDIVPRCILCGTWHVKCGWLIHLSPQIFRLEFVNYEVFMKVHASWNSWTCNIEPWTWIASRTMRLLLMSFSISYTLCWIVLLRGCSK